MATVLVYTSPGRGHLFPIMDTALALSKRGHDVRVRTLAAEVDLVVRAGLSARAMSSTVEARAIDDWKVRSPLESARRSVRTFVDRAASEVEDMRRAIVDEGPQLLLVDTNAWARRRWPRRRGSRGRRGIPSRCPTPRATRRPSVLASRRRGERWGVSAIDCSGRWCRAPGRGFFQSSTGCEPALAPERSRASPRCTSRLRSCCT